MLSLYLLVVIIAIAYGLQYRSSGSAANLYFLVFTGCFVIALSLLAWCVFACWPRMRQPTGQVDLLGFVMTAFSLVMTLYFRSGFLGGTGWPLVAAVTTGSAWYCYRTWGARGATAAFLVASLVGYVIVDAQSRSVPDMLPTIEAAAKELLAGSQPYRAYPEIYPDPTRYPHNSQFPLSYLPGLWLPYVPLVAAGMNPSVLNFAALFLIVLVFEKGLAPGPDRPRVLALTLYPLLASPLFARFVTAGHLWPYYALIVLLCWLLWQRRYRWAAITLGLALATRQSALFLVGPIAAFMYVQVGVPRLLRYAGITVAVYLSLVLPFAFWWGNDVFWRHLYLGFSSLADDIYLVQRQIGLASAMQALGLAGAMSLIQALIVLSMSAFIVVRKQGDLAWFFCAMGVTYITLVMFSPYAVRYVYYPGFFMVALGLVVALGGDASSPSR
jgi:hypothetical protein